MDLQALLRDDAADALSDEELVADAEAAAATRSAPSGAVDLEEGELPDEAPPPPPASDAAASDAPQPPPAAGGRGERTQGARRKRDDAAGGRGRGVKRPRDPVRERLDAQFSAEVRDAAARIAEQLKEKKVHLLRRLCDRFGVSLANEVLQETLTVESAGGLLTADGARRREAGGTYMTLFAARVPKPDMKQVLAAAAKDLRELQTVSRQGDARPAQRGAGSGRPPPVPRVAAEDADEDT